MNDQADTSEIVAALQQLEELLIQLGAMQDLVGSIFELIQERCLEELF